MPIRPRRLSLFVAVLLVAGAVPSARAATSVTACGQHVSGSAVLAGDLDCTGGGPVGVYLDHGGTLDLGGFTLSQASVGVRCERPCKVVNGTLLGNGTAVLSFATAKVRDVIIDGIGETTGVVGVKGVNLRNVELQNLSQGFDSEKGNANLRNVHMDGGTRCGHAAKVVKLVDSSVVNCDSYGLLGFTVRLIRSTVTNNGSDGVCTTPPCGDVLSFKRPKLARSTCDRSLAMAPPPANWGVCTLD